MSGPLLSVIVPVYKAQSCLEPCVRSILAQGLTEMEVLLVEDGSPDESGRLCDALARQDSRIVALHQENRGAAAARNAGLQAARGAYITFVDADDTLLPGLYQEALPYMRAAGLDWYGFGVRRAGGGELLWPRPGLYQTLAALQGQLQALTVDDGQLALLYNKIYARSLIQEQRFEESLAVNEDLLFNLQVLKGSGAFYLAGQAFYLYEDTAQGSLSRRLRTDLLEAEALTRPAYRVFLGACGLAAPQAEPLLAARQADAARLQFFLLTGQKGQLPFARRRGLLAQCLRCPPGRRAILAQLRADPNRLFALPYRFCAALRLPGLLALYCGLKEPFLP